MNVDGIFGADLHIRPDVPVCRTDDFLSAMGIKLRHIMDLCELHNCPLVISGDVGNRPQWPNWLIEWYADILYPYKQRILVIPGQHDLPDHSLAEIKRSAIGVLAAAGLVRILNPQSYYPIADGWKVAGFAYGEEIKECGDANMAVIHKLVLEEEMWWAEGKGETAISILQKYPQYSLILSGDNHKPFVTEYEGRLLVNPGSMMRSTAIQTDHKPRVYLWDAKENRVEPSYLPIEDGVVVRHHIEVKEAKEQRMTAFVEHARKDFETGLSYEKNLEEYFLKNTEEEKVKKKVWVAYGD